MATGLALGRLYLRAADRADSCHCPTLAFRRAFRAKTVKNALLSSRSASLPLPLALGLTRHSGLSLSHHNSRLSCQKAKHARTKRGTPNLTRALPGLLPCTCFRVSTRDTCTCTCPSFRWQFLNRGAIVSFMFPKALLGGETTTFLPLFPPPHCGAFGFGGFGGVSSNVLLLFLFLIVLLLCFSVCYFAVPPPIAPVRPLFLGGREEGEGGRSTSLIRHFIISSKPHHRVRQIIPTPTSIHLSATSFKGRHLFPLPSKPLCSQATPHPAPIFKRAKSQSPHAR